MTLLLSGFISLMSPWTLILLLVAMMTMAFLGAPLVAWTAGAAVVLLAVGAPTWFWVAFGLIALIFNLPPLRRNIVTRPVMAVMKKTGFLPAISETERAALEAGTVWVEGELFSGKPDFARILQEPWPELDEREVAFLEGPVEEVCRMISDWDVFQRRDLPDEVWAYLKQHGFFGMIIPQKYGGLAFSPPAISAIIGKLCSRCGPVGITVMIPNSLGPGELLSHYGTEAQKDYWLPRLARGEDLPCFALTEPEAGSDAGAMTSTAVVFRGDSGEAMLRLNWNKRYISLSGRATVMGLAVKLTDPDNLLGAGTNPGITCVLLPADTPGVQRDRRHDPLGVPFSNSPLQGKDVEVPASSIIGGPSGAGQGWRMLMECLAAGRGIMLPAQATAGVKLAARVTGSYATIRRQFGLPIGKFEGIVEPLARIGGWSYILGSALPFTAGGLSRGKPAVASAMAKYNFTELFRKALNDGMDIMGGAAIVKGPRNLFAHPHIAAPIAITVEGANILTRTLMIFGQGAIRCHPFAQREIKAMEEGDVAGFDAAFFGHIGHVGRNKARAFLLSLTRGRLAQTGPLTGISAAYARKLSWASATFAFTADVAMALLGGNLKRRESLTGRFSDAFSWLYLATAVLRRFEADGRRPEDEIFFRWSMEYAMVQIQTAFDGIFRNFDVPLIGWLYRGPIAMWSRMNSLGHGPGDRLDQEIAKALQTPDARRERLLDGLYLPDDPSEALGRLERTFRLCVEADGLVAKVKQGMRDGRLKKGSPMARLADALEAGILTPDEAKKLEEAERARLDAIQVDSFTEEEYMATAARDSKPQPIPEDSVPV